MEPAALIFLAAIPAGAVASVAGFGIGSLLTPLLAVQVGTKLAVAAISIPHFVGTALRCWMLRQDIERKVLLSFGLSSAAGGLVGACIHSCLDVHLLSVMFGVILVVAGAAGVSGLSEKLRFRGWLAWLAGAVSGTLGGLVGNQGGIRSAALLGFDLNKNAFVATSTVIGLIVDGVRMPVYFIHEFNEMMGIKLLIAAATAGVVIGTLIGKYFLQNIQEKIFKRFVSGIILLLGLWMLVSGVPV